MANNKIQLPAIRLRNLVVFPGMILHFDIAREESINAVNNREGSQSISGN